MARKRAAKAADSGKQTPRKEAGVTTKADAVRAALAAGKSLPDEGVAYVKAEFGLDISKAMFSSYKTAEKARARKKVGRLRGQRASGAATSAPSWNGQADVIQAVVTVKQLVDRLGADQVRRLVDVFG